MSYKLFFIIFFFSCINLRDYVETKKGFFSLNYKKSFGQGIEEKDYFIISDEIIIVKDDTKEEIIKKLGSPQKIEYTLDGFVSFLYPQKKLELFFEKEKLKFWRNLN